MLGIVYLSFFLGCGFIIARFLLPRVRPLLRGYIGLSLGLLLVMWLPVLVAYFMAFTRASHLVAAVLMSALTLLCYVLRHKQEPVKWDSKEYRATKLLILLVLPMTVLAAYLQYTHSIRPDIDGGYHVGQSTYGDLSLHLAVTTSIVNAKFPLHNSLMHGASMAYPYLSDSFASTMYMLGLPLHAAMSFTGTFMMALVFSGYTLLCVQLCKHRGSAALAVCLLFFNGGFGFFYTLSGRVENGSVVTLWDNLRTVMEGFYKTPTNQPIPYNLRWSNIICDMLLPQRGILGGWTMLLPCFNLLIPPLARKEPHSARVLCLLGVFAGGLPLLHTHSFLALALSSGGMCLFTVVAAGKKKRWPAFKPWLFYVAITAILALPQLLIFTIGQAVGSEHFLRVQFNWCNNLGGRGMVDPYFWFYIKNIGWPYLLILLALCQRKTPQTNHDKRGRIDQYRLVAWGAFSIYIIGELVLFQPNEYDNNKLFYVWFMLCLPMAADYAFSLYGRLKGIGGRWLIAGFFIVTSFLSAGLTVAREWVSDYAAYSKADREVADFVMLNTPEHSVFITGNQHLNPISSLAGRTILCSSDIYLYYHGFNTAHRRREVSAFYTDPQSNLATLGKYGVKYVYVSDWERQSEPMLNEAALEALFEISYESAGGRQRIFAVPEELWRYVGEDESVFAIFPGT